MTTNTMIDARDMCICTCGRAWLMTLNLV